MQGGNHRDLAARKRRAPGDKAGFGFHDPLRCHTDFLHLRRRDASFVQELPDGSDQDRGKLSASAVALSKYCVLPRCDRTGEINERQIDRVHGQPDADRVGRFRIEPQKVRGRPRAWGDFGSSLSRLMINF
jgi:hypothetical protein